MYYLITLCMLTIVMSILPSHHNQTVNLAFNQSGYTLAIAYENYTTVYLRNTLFKTKPKLIPTDHGDGITSLDYAHHAPLLLCGSSDTRCSIINTDSLEEGTYLQQHTQEVTCCKFGHDARTCVTGSADRTLLLWDTSRARTIRTLVRAESAITALFYNGRANLVTWAAIEKNAHTIDTRAPIVVHTLARHNGQIYGLDGKGHFRATGGEDGYIRLWDMRSLKQSYDCYHARIPVHTVLLHPEKNVVASGLENGCVITWSPQQRTRCAPTVTRHRKQITSTCYSSNGCLLASASQDGTVKLKKPEFFANLKKSDLLEKSKPSKTEVLEAVAAQKTMIHKSWFCCVML